MKVDLSPQGEIRTNMTITLKISEVSNPPLVEVKDLGQVVLRKVGNVFVGDFWSQKEGKYQVFIRGDNGTWSKTINIEKQEYITFNQEMSVFGGLLLFGALGLILWMKKIKKS
ncbi:MAG: hypothetical protein ACHQYQ_09280 [Bacteriovoracales bacterium]